MEKHLKVGDAVPSLKLKGLDPEGAEGEFDLAELTQGRAIVYFYPKDNTPGCTTEACDFRDNLQRLAAAGIKVIGISPDPIESHKKFRQKHGLNFYLLSDPQKEAAKLFGAYGKKKRYGREVEGIIRSTFLVEKGTIQKEWRNVRAKGHVERLLKELGL